MKLDGDIANAEQAMFFRNIWDYLLVDKMIVLKVAMVYPSAVFVSVLVFSPPLELPPDECSQPDENTLRVCAL